MIKLLSRLFIKDGGNTSDPRVRRAYGVLASCMGIVLNIILFAGKYFAGTLSGSVAIAADAFNNLSDAGSSLVTLVGFKFAGKKPDPQHPFGHGRIEYLSGLVVSALILVMGVELAKSSIGKIISPEPVESGLLPMLILAASICVKLYMCLYNRAIGSKINSAAMKATSMDSLSDSVATAVVLVSTLIGHFTSVNIDGWCGALVSLFILYAGFNAARETLRPLLGTTPDPELVQEIQKLVMAYPEAAGIHDLIVHDYGPGRLIISLHVEVPGNGDIFALHDAIDCMERELTAKLGCQATIHMDPIATDDSHVKAYRDEVAEMARSIDENVTIHDFRIVDGPTHTNLIFDMVLPVAFKMTEEQAQEKISELIKNRWENCFAVVSIDRNMV